MYLVLFYSPVFSEVDIIGGNKSLLIILPVFAGAGLLSSWFPRKQERRKGVTVFVWEPWGHKPHVLLTDFVPSLGSREENGFFFSFLQVPTGSPNPGQSTRLVFLILLELGIILITKICMSDTTNPPPSNHIPEKSTNILQGLSPTGETAVRVDDCSFCCAEAFLFDIPLLCSW